MANSSIDEVSGITSDTAEFKTFVHSSTKSCATEKLCIPCHYKIFPNGTFSSIHLPPNQRPEQCLRAKSGPYSGLYKSHHRLLTLGDGDFSFSLSIAKNVNFTTGSLTATSHESNEQLLSTYNAVGIKDILKELKTRSITTLHGVDATNIDATSSIEKRFYDAIVWNFPCVRAENGADGQSSEIEINRQLLRDFFNNIHPYLQPGTGQLHITHKTFEPFSWWEIGKLADECGFEHQCSLVFDRCLYPGYINRKVLDKKSFPLHDARTFVFVEKKCSAHVVGDGAVVSLASDRIPVVCAGSAYPLDSDLVQMSSEVAQSDFMKSVKKVSGLTKSTGNSKQSRKSDLIADSSFSSSGKKRRKG